MSAESARKWRIANLNKHREKNRLWANRNRGAVRASLQRHIARDPEHYRETRALSRRKRDAQERATQKVGRISYKRILERDNWICHICKVPIFGEHFADLHFDHIVPLSKGGEHSEANIAVSHAWCNLSKGARLIA